MEKIEDRKICAKCGGLCCKKSGCDFFVSDFENFKLDYLENILATGRVSIIASLIFHNSKNGTLYCSPFLSLRARNIDRGEIDLFSLKKTCASLEDNGCHFSLENRPSGGATLIPKKHHQCYSEIDRTIELEKWSPYQNILARIVKRHTGKSVNAKLEEDVENVFYDILAKNFGGVMDIEI